MTLLTMCTEVLEEAGFPSLATIVGNTDPQAKQMLALAKAELRSISKEYDWPQLEVEYTFDTVDGTATYALPDAFRKLGIGGMFDTEEYYKIRGSMSADKWHTYKYGLLGSVSHKHFRLTYSPVTGLWTINLTTTPTSANTIALLYYTKNFIYNAGEKETYTADTDVSKVPESLVQLGLRYRFRRAKGLDYSAELAEYNTTVKQQLATAKSLGEIPVGGKPYLPEITCGTIPENGFGV